MNDRSIPEILKDPARFDACAREVAQHILGQPAHIDIPITFYGGCLENNHPVNRQVLISFYRAMCRAGASRWTNQLAPYPVEHARLEDAIARNVYLGHLALTIEGEQSCS